MVIGSSLNEQEKREFHSWMYQRNIYPRCPICRSTSFHNHERVSPNSMDKVTLIGEILSPAIQIECERCGYKMQFGGAVAAVFFGR